VSYFTTGAAGVDGRTLTRARSSEEPASSSKKSETALRQVLSLLALLVQKYKY
jgi:hypothetical protein